jgi:hypothetical protein
MSCRKCSSMSSGLPSSEKRRGSSGAAAPHHPFCWQRSCRGETHGCDHADRRLSTALKIDPGLRIHISTRPTDRVRNASTLVRIRPREYSRHEKSGQVFVRTVGAVKAVFIRVLGGMSGGLKLRLDATGCDAVIASGAHEALPQTARRLVR